MSNTTINHGVIITKIIISKLERLLQTEKNKKQSDEIKPMTIDEFNKMIDQSEDDFINGREINTKDCLKRLSRGNVWDMIHRVKNDVD